MAVSKSYPTWVPTDKYYTQLEMRDVADFNFGETLTHEDYNYYINKTFEYARYNNTVLAKLFSEDREGDAYRIPYIDKRIQALEILATDTWNDLQIAEDNIDALQQNIIKIINGTTVVGHAKIADKVNGIDEAGKLRYYGTNLSSAPGFHELPPMVYTERIDQAKSVNVDGIYFVPSLDTVSEAMLTPELRNKINARSIALDGEAVTMAAPTPVPVAAVPSIDTSKFLTELPSNLVYDETLEKYLTIKDYENDKELVKSELMSYADSKYFNIASVLDEFKEDVKQHTSRIYINEIPANPKAGDMVVML